MLRHIHARKRKSRGLEPYPARGFWLRLLDRVVLLAGIVGPIATIPQIINIYDSHSAGSVSPPLPPVAPVVLAAQRSQSACVAPAPSLDFPAPCSET